MQRIITGIQHVGIGVTNAEEAWNWYRKYFAMDVVIFNDNADAPLMTRYTGGQIHTRQEIFAMNRQSGGGFEIGEFTSRKPEASQFKINLGDTGIQIINIKCRDIHAAYIWFKKENLNLKSEIISDPRGKQTFYTEDPYGNVFQLVESDYWFINTGHLCGGIAGAVIAVSSMEQAMNFYTNVLNIKNMVYDLTMEFEEWKNFEGGNKKFRRILILQDPERKGAFSKLLGPFSIELIQAIDYLPHKIFANRCWGDQGFIHLCFDIVGMSLLRKDCARSGYPFKVDSAESFAMGKAAGHFAFIEDPEGTLIEFVEVQKVPIIKKLGWYLNLKKRDAAKPLPDWILKVLGWNKTKK